MRCSLNTNEECNNIHFEKCETCQDRLSCLCEREKLGKAKEIKMKKKLDGNEVVAKFGKTEYYIQVSGEIYISRDETDPGNPEFLGCYDYNWIGKVNMEINDLPEKCYHEEMWDLAVQKVENWLAEKLPEWWNDPVSNVLSELMTGGYHGSN